MVKRERESILTYITGIYHSKTERVIRLWATSYYAMVFQTVAGAFVRAAGRAKTDWTLTRSGKNTAG